MKKIIGFNLIIDINNVNEKFFEKKILLKLLKKLIEVTKSYPVGQPLIKKISSNKYSYEGFSILQIIQESHIALHTWPEYNYLAVDIFSCKKFNEKRVISVFKKNLNQEIKLRIKIYQRITEY